MLIAKVIGTTVSTIKDEQLTGQNYSSSSKQMRLAQQLENPTSPLTPSTLAWEIWC